MLRLIPIRKYIDEQKKRRESLRFFIKVKKKARSFKAPATKADGTRF